MNWCQNWQATRTPDRPQLRPGRPRLRRSRRGNTARRRVVVGSAKSSGPLLKVAAQVRHLGVPHPTRSAIKKRLLMVERGTARTAQSVDAPITEATDPPVPRVDSAADRRSAPPAVCAATHHPILAVPEFARRRSRTSRPGYSVSLAAEMLPGWVHPGDRGQVDDGISLAPTPRILPQRRLADVVLTVGVALPVRPSAAGRLAALGWSLGIL